jgi:RimJ/RimL family protein N-acetyltransferase
MRTRRLVLRAPRLTDARAIFDRYAQDAAVARFMIWRPHGSLAETEAFVQGCVEGWARGSRCAWVITRPADGAVLGMIEARLDGHAAGIGYVLARSEWGQGYMTEAATAVVAELLALAAIYRVWAVCDVDNHASARVLEKAGLTLEGRLRRCIVHPNVSPEPRDVFCYARVR